MKVVTVVGTRPEIIRLSSVIGALDDSLVVEHVLVHTGQNWDRQLNDVFFDELGIIRPRYTLQVDTSSLGATLGDVLRRTEDVLARERPDAFLVLGDTNSALSLIMAKRMKIATYHMEAGNRCFDANVPEEVNRRIIDHTADFNLVYTEHARQNLIAEGIETRRILKTGSPLQEVLGRFRSQIQSQKVLQTLGLRPQKYFLVSAHREENVDNPIRLVMLLQSLNAVAQKWGLPIIVSTHPRTQQRIDALVEKPVIDSLIAFEAPFGFFDYCQLQMNALCVISDSGTIAEEASIAGFKAVTLRPSIERPEALDTGAIAMVDLEPRVVVQGISWALSGPVSKVVPDDYLIANTSERVVNFILSTAPHHKYWSGLR